MKKVTKVVAFAMLCILTLSLVACDVKPQISNIPAPTLTLDGNAIRWSIVDEASSYNVYLNGELHKSGIVGFRYSLSTLRAGTYTVGVKAVNENGESEMSNTVTYTKNATVVEETDNTAIDLVSNASYNYGGLWKSAESKIMTRQLKDEQLWADFVNQFRSNVDEPTPTEAIREDGGGWRGEFWGKMMMGAAEIYEETCDEELYQVLENTTRDLLTTQTPDGRIATYGRLSEGGYEFSHWDLWCRKYVLNGMEAFYDICKDQALKKQLEESMLAQLDYIMSYVGEGADQISILSSSAKGGLAACSMLEALVRLYEITGEQRVLDFATYVAESGGSTGSNLLEKALENEGWPYQWGATKAYEYTSYMKGLLDYYILTGVEKFKTAGLNFAYKIIQSEVTVTGGAGYHSEEFNYSVREQANPDNTYASMETCVAVTITHLFYTAYQITGDTLFIDTIERTMYNALYGAIDKEGCYNHVFTSYYNLMYYIKPTSAAGGLQMKERSYGCCIAIGALGIGLIHNMQFNVDSSSVYANFYMPGETSFTSCTGKQISFKTETNYPSTGTVKMTLSTSEAQTFALKLRIPEWSSKTSISVNGVGMGGINAGEYYTISREWKDGDVITLSLDMRATLYYGSEECPNENAKYNVAVLRGPLVLARDNRLGEDLFQTVNFAIDEDGYVIMEPSSTASFETICEFALKLTDGSYIHMVDWASAGGTYSNESMLTVFMPTTDYWNKELDLSAKMVFVCDKGWLMGTSDGMFTSGGFAADYNDYSEFAMVLTDRGNGYYTISKYGSPYVMTVTPSGGSDRLSEQAYTGSDAQLFQLVRSGLFCYKIVAKYNGALVSMDTNSILMHLYSDCGSDTQRWRITVLDN